MSSRTVAAAWALLAASLAAGQVSAPSPEELVARERARSAMAGAIERIREHEDDASMFLDGLVRESEALRPLGKALLPWIKGEMERHDPVTHLLCVFLLGGIEEAEAGSLLREALSDADEGPGRAAVEQKAWVAWAMAARGDAEVIDLMDEGRHRASVYELAQSTTLIETAAVLTAPDSIPRLYARLDGLEKADPPRDVDLAHTVRAISWVDPVSGAARVARHVTEHPTAAVRAEVAWSLRLHESPEAEAALRRALSDEATGVRVNAANALNRVRARVPLDELTVRLGVETDFRIRGLLLSLVARSGDPRATETLRGALATPHPIERAAVVSALATLDDEAALLAVNKALGDKDNNVALAAIRGLAARNEAVHLETLVADLETCPPLHAREIATILAERGHKSAARAIATRLVQRELDTSRDQEGLRRPIEWMGAALVEFRHLPALAPLRRALEQQTRRDVIVALTPVVQQLEALDRNGVKLSRWAATLDSDDPKLRELSYRRLAEIDSRESIVLLTARFEAMAPDEQPLLLRALGRARGDVAQEFVARVLLDPRYDEYRMSKLRDEAAWAARRIGGDRMRSALSAAVERRRGRDWRPLVYTALLGGEEAREQVRRLRARRTAFPNPGFGHELDSLVALDRALREGWPLGPWDLSPDRLQLM